MDEYHGSELFLKDARAAARAKGYNPALLDLARDGVHKLVFNASDGRRIKFGARTYGDFLFYKRFYPAIASEKRRAYLARATKIKGDWRSDRFSKNNLAQAILWSG